MICAVFRQVVLCAFLSDFARGHADKRVLAGIKILRQMKKLEADRTFFERAARIGNPALNDVQNSCIACPDSSVCKHTQSRPSAFVIYKASQRVFERFLTWATNG